MSLTRPSVEILGKTRARVFPISVFLVIDQNCHYSRTSHDIDMQLGPIIKTDKKNTATLKKTRDVLSTNFDVIIFFPIYGQFAPIWKPDSGRMGYKTYVFNNNNLLSNISNRACILLLWVKILFLPKHSIVCKKNAEINKIKEAFVHFQKLNMCGYLHTKIHVSSIILTSFRQKNNFTPQPKTNL